ncbi:MAG: zinc ribbon domain-containing protein [Bacilli bacterium]|nr:zinc ribbon domain-containing protein [Bacilli bacterium]
MKCKNCGAENQEGAKFCSSCGSKLVEEAEVVEEVKPNANEVRCRICGHINTTGDQYCKLCGSQLQAKPTPTYTNTNGSYSSNNSIYANNKTSTPGMVIGIVSLVSSITCCLFLVGLIGGIAGIFMNIKPIKYNYVDKSKAIAGLICSIVAAIIAAYLLYSIIAVLTDPELMEEIRQYYESIYGEGTQTGLMMFSL